MRDLLTDLVRRTLRPELTVQPRLASRYEPHANAGTTAIDVDVEGAATRSATHTDRPDATVTPAAVRRAPNAPARDAIERDSRPVAPAHPRPAASSTVRSREADPASTPLGPAPPTSTPDALPGPAAAAQARDAERTIAPRTATTVLGRRETNTPEPTFVRLPLPASIAATRPDAMNRSDRPPVATDGSAGDAHEVPPPEIRISIGRIDVRAAVTTSGAATRRSDRPTGPAQSLDDYLGARARGARR